MSVFARIMAARHLRAGLRMAAAGRLHRAVERLENAVRLDPVNAHTQLHLATALASLERYDAATRAADRALRMCPREPAFLILAGEVFLDADLPEQARRLFVRALRMNPANRLARAYAILARWRATGDISCAERLEHRGAPDSTAFLSRLLMTVEERIRPELHRPAERALRPHVATPTADLSGKREQRPWRHPITRLTESYR